MCVTYSTISTDVLPLPANITINGLRNGLTGTPYLHYIRTTISTKIKFPRLKTHATTCKYVRWKKIKKYVKSNE